MHVVYVVNDFPVTSESFIIRASEDLSCRDDIKLSICVLGCYNQELLSILSPMLKDKVSSGIVSIHHSQDSFKLSSAKYLRAALRASRTPLSFVSALYKSQFSLKMVLKSLVLKEFLPSDTDVLHCQYLNLAPVAVLEKVCFSHGRYKIVSSIRGFDVTNKNVTSAHEICIVDQYVDCLFSVSESLASKAVERGVNRNKIKVVHSGLSLDKFSYLPPSKKDSSERLQSERLKIVQVGRMVEKKGYQLTLQLLSCLPDSYEFIFVGNGVLKEELLEKADYLGVRERVCFKGELSHTEVASIIRESNVLLVPSMTDKNGDSEGIPNVAKEAMALGTIVVASDHSGLPELIVDKKTGYMFKEGDINDYFETFRHAINQLESWDGLAKEARSFVEKNYDQVKISEFLVSQYRLLS